MFLVLDDADDGTSDGVEGDTRDKRLLEAEACVYELLRRVFERRTFYVISTTPRRDQAVKNVFMAQVDRLMPRTAAVLKVDDQQRVIDKQLIDPIFHRLFVPLLARHEVMLLVDRFLRDGWISQFRCGLALLKITKRRVKSDRRKSLAAMEEERLGSALLGSMTLSELSDEEWDSEAPEIDRNNRPMSSVDIAHMFFDLLKGHAATVPSHEIIRRGRPLF